MFQMMSEFALASHATTVEEYNVAAPASPTAALYDEAESRPRSKSSKLQKRVVFCQDVKEHDGLTTRSAVFDRLVTMYFVNQQEVSELDVLRIAQNDLLKINQLHEDLQDISARIQAAVEDGRQCAPVLPRGGGLCTKLCPPHVVFIQVLDRVVEAAGNRVAKAMALTKTHALTATEVNGDVVMA